MKKLKINPQLVISSHSDPTKDRISKNIKSLIEMIDNNELVLPIFQTDIRWKVEHAVSLFNFQLNGHAPVAPISFNRLTQPNHNMLNVTFIDRQPISFDEMKSKSEDIFNVVDGQQRISTNYKAATNSEDFKDVVLDLKKGAFTISANKSSCQIPVGMLYNKDSRIFADYIKSHGFSDFEIMNLLTQVRTKFFNYDYAINNAINLSFENQMEWFDILNLAGSKLPHVQMRLTNLQVKGLDFYKNYSRPFTKQIEDAFGDIFTMKSTEISNPLSALNAAYQFIKYNRHEKSNFSPMPSDQKVDLICKLEKTEIEQCFAITLNSLSKATNFIEQNNVNIFESGKPRIDYITYLQGFFVFYQNDIIPSDLKNKLTNWLRDNSFANKNNSERRKMYDQLVSLTNAN